MFWTDPEKASIIARAIEIQNERPDLAGLPLLRSAMRSLPSDRRRTIISLSQVPWFDRGIHAAASARAETRGRHGDDPYLPLLETIAHELQKITAWVIRHPKD